MPSGMQGVAVALLATGTWITYAGYEGIPPLKTIQDIIKNPTQAQEIVSASKHAVGAIASGGGSAVVAFARAQIGKPYQLGGAGPDVWDCSGLTMVAYRQVGVSMPHSALAQTLIGQRISSKDQLQPGDLLFPNFATTLFGDHVQIYSGNGMIIEAPMPGVPVRERTVWGSSGTTIYATRPQVDAQNG